MAYRVSNSAHRKRLRPSPGGGTLSRNALIAGVSFASLTLACAGVLLSATHEFPATPSNSRAFKVALIDPAPPAVMTRDPRIAIAVPDADITMTRPAAMVAATPLPAARPERVAVIPLPRQRIALAFADIKAEPETTGSLGPAASEAAPAKPRTAAAVVAKPRRALTPQEKLWGGPVRVASLGPADGVRATGFDPKSGLPAAPYDRQTAVYVIGDRKVYMPDGTTLEAHSGLGDKMDDPAFVHLRMRGATPPHVYDLAMRESLFHGVAAIRMKPIGGEDAIFGRDGLLAHSYMLGAKGQSNGCVSFKDYEAFLDAFKAGKITRLAVLARLD